MDCIWEKAISILAGNLNSGRRLSYYSCNLTYSLCTHALSATMRNLLSGWPWFHHFFAELDPNFCKVDCLGLVNVKFKFPLHFAVASCAITTCTKKLLATKKSIMGEISLFSFVLSFFLNLLIWKLKIHNAVTTFVQSHL